MQAKATIDQLMNIVLFLNLFRITSKQIRKMPIANVPAERAVSMESLKDRTQRITSRKRIPTTSMMGKANLKNKRNAGINISRSHKKRKKSIISSVTSK
jgi:hypothetical protein